jgi:tetratricopeptide (TPR) repeat protein
MLGLLVAAVASGCASTQDQEVRRLRARALYEQGLDNLKDSRVSLALASLREAVQLDPENPVYRNAVGAVLLNLQRPAEAEPELRKAVELDPDFAEAHHNLGLALAEQRRFDDAIIAYRKALSFPTYQTPEVAYYNLGNAYLALKKVREAEEAYRAAIQLSPKLVAAYYQLGLILTQSGRKDEALSAFRAARDLDPSSAFGRAAGEALKTLGEGG